MIYLFWSLPLVAIGLLMASGRVSSVGAGLSGAVLAGLVALAAAPVPMTAFDVATAAAKGLWLAWLVAAVILAGLFFRDIVSGDDGRARPPPAGPEDRRRRAFAACFLVGPFAEAATGFGVGQVATIAMLRGIGLAPLHVVLLALFSQILVPWGAMANGTLVGAEFAGLSPRELGTSSAILSVPLLAIWLALFWRMAKAAGLEGSGRLLATELAWVLATAVLLILTNRQLGPEIAALVALGPLIVLQFWRDERPDRAAWLSTLRVGLPYAGLIAGLAASRGIPALADGLGHAAALRPFADSPAWLPLLHPGSWLLAVGLVTALVSGRRRAIGPAAGSVWRNGRNSVLTIAVYLVVARIMADSGIAAALALGLRQVLGPFAALATPWLAGTFGFLTGSGNASNGLLMTSQAGIASDGRIPLAWIAAIQNTAAAALTMLSPARVAMGCALVGHRELERAVYRKAWPLGAAPLVALSILAALFIIGS
ncbi:MAG: L-lactate permease [Rhizobiales bacterium]|nr:L-lactate permease [Hyphomicrobiales bacterium]